MKRGALYLSPTSPGNVDAVPATTEQVKKLIEKKSEPPDVDKVVVFEGTVDGQWVIGFDDLEKLGEAYLDDHPPVVQEMLSEALTRPVRA